MPPSWPGGRSGSPRLTLDLADAGEVFDRKTVANSQRRQGLRAKAAQKFKATTNSDHSLPVAPNLLKQDFTATAPCQKWVGPELLTVLRRIEARSALDTAHRVHQNCGKVFRYAVATGRAQRDPSGDLRGAIPPAQEHHHPIIIEPKRVGELLRAIAGYSGSYTL